MTTNICETKWHNLDALILENEFLRTVIVPALGGKIASLLDKRSRLDWLVGPGNRRVQPIEYGSLWHEQDMSGWDEMFPTIIACNYPGPGALNGRPLPDHGEVWTLPWHVEKANGGTLTLSVEGQALPYNLTRTADYVEPSTLWLHYQVVNESAEPLVYLWAAHPQFTCGSDGRIVLPSNVTEVINTIPASWGWGEPETTFSWPEAASLDGTRVHLDKVGPPSLRRGRKFFALPDVHPGWAGVLRTSSGSWLRLDWDPARLPYFGLWVDEGALNHESVAAPEPTTGFYDDLAVAWKKQRVSILAAHATHEWDLLVQLGVDGKGAP
jgi:hypothetical protein